MTTSPAQTVNGAPPTGYSLKIDSQIVILDVVVTDRKGRIVTNLAKDQFSVFEDKVPQTLTAVDSPEADLEPGLGGRGVPIKSTADLDRTEPNAPVSIIVLDEINSRFEDEAFARYSLKRYLNTQDDALLQPTMLIAVNLERIAVLCDYTTSKKEVLSALEHHLAANPWRADDNSWRSERFNSTFGALMQVAEASSGHLGHKNMIWIGRGLPPVNPLSLNLSESEQLKDALATCTEMLRRSRVTLYAIDPDGLTVQPAAKDTSGGFLEDPFGVQVDFAAIAKATGGQSLYGRNDVDNLIGLSIQGGKDFYTLVYTPAKPTQTDKPFRHIRVVLKDPRLHAITRAGYYTRPPSFPEDFDASGRPSGRLRFDIATAASGLMVYDGVPLTVARDATIADNFHLSIGASDIPWKMGDMESQQADLTVLVESFDVSGKVISSSAKLFTVKRPLAAASDSLAPAPVQLMETIATRPPAVRLRFVVRVNSTGRVGANNFFLVEPTKVSRN